MSSTSYLFYDLETTGLNKAFDQVQQCAIKRLDKDFNECESHFFEVALSPDTVPSAYAVLTHQISLDNDVSRQKELHALRDIHSIFNTPNSISLGYNTLGFDDEFLRFSFYRNLLTPYTHQYAQGCGRMDIFPMTVFYYLYAPDSIRWPEQEGSVSLKLERISHENGWEDGQAHHAMHDVDATIKLARALRSANPPMWEYLTGFFHKTTDQDRIRKLATAWPDGDKVCGLLISSKFGAKQAFQAPVLYLGGHHTYRNQTIWLRLDKILIDDVEDFTYLEEQGCIIKKKTAEPGFLLPWISRYDQHLSKDRRAIAKDNLVRLQANSIKLAKLTNDACTALYPKVCGIDADAYLYEQGFRNNQQQAICTQLHNTPLHSWASAIEDIDDDILREQALRCLWRYDANLLSPAQHTQTQHLGERIFDNSNTLVDYLGRQRHNLESLQQEVETLSKENVSKRQLELIEELKLWIEKKRKREYP